MIYKLLKSYKLSRRKRAAPKSKEFNVRFSEVTQDEIVEKIDENTNIRRGGIVGEYAFSLYDVNGDLHEFQAESFFNHYYILTLVVHKKALPSKRNNVIFLSKYSDYNGFGGALP